MDGDNVVVYREPYGDQYGSYNTSMPSMSYLAQLEAHEAAMDHEQALRHEDDVSDVVEVEPEVQFVGPIKRKKKRPRQSNPDDASYLLFHKAKQHEADKNYHCRFCEAEFVTNMALHNHLNETHPLKLLPCPYCDKRFMTKSNLNQHVNTHQEPRFNCEQCPRQFHTRGDLRKHIVFKHTNEKKFQCPDCDQCFKVNWLLNRHKVRVHPT